jgi:hypothetical protein
MKDHAFKVHLSPFLQVPAKVTGVDKTLFRQHPPMEQTCWIVERVDLRGINQFPPHGDVHLSHGQCTFHGNTTLPRSSIRDLQILAQQHFSVRDPVIATDGAALIGSDGYLMSLRRDAVVVAVPRHVWDWN